MTSQTNLDPAELPTTIATYLTAHAARDTDAAIRTFGPDAVVVDDGSTYRGTDEVFDFLQKAGAQFSYTTDLTGAERIDGEHWVAHVRIEGDFPGGVADLTYRFTLEGDRITELVIGA